MDLEQWDWMGFVAHLESSGIFFHICLNHQCLCRGGLLDASLLLEPCLIHVQVVRAPNRTEGGIFLALGLS